MTVVDPAWLERLADLADAKVEVDQDGGVVVSPASDRHVIAVTRLAVQLATQITGDHEVLAEGPRWSPLGGLAPSYVPDLSVVATAALARPEGDYELRPPPLLVVEVLSPATRRRDLGEKEANYDLGGALMYWTLELPGLADVETPQLRARARGLDGWEAGRKTRSGQVQLLPGQPFPEHVTVDVGRLL